MTHINFNHCIEMYDKGKREMRGFSTGLMTGIGLTIILIIAMFLHGIIKINL